MANPPNQQPKEYADDAVVMEQLFADIRAQLDKLQEMAGETAAAAATHHSEAAAREQALKDELLQAENEAKEALNAHAITTEHRRKMDDAALRVCLLCDSIDRIAAEVLAAKPAPTLAEIRLQGISDKLRGICKTDLYPLRYDLLYMCLDSPEKYTSDSVLWCTFFDDRAKKLEEMVLKCKSAKGAFYKLSQELQFVTSNSTYRLKGLDDTVKEMTRLGNGNGALGVAIAALESAKDINSLPE
ncbi:MAG: hypothetical protein LBR73_01785 [Oscillospiraceae bacterium]|jgi:hypothetical protein|nr:hypothetical protein [Oscillospiraceae bacterium]